MLEKVDKCFFGYSKNLRKIVEKLFRNQAICQKNLAMQIGDKIGLNLFLFSVYCMKCIKPTEHTVAPHALFYNQSQLNFFAEINTDPCWNYAFLIYS